MNAPEYHKIQTIYKRDPLTKYKTLLEGEFSLPEFEYLANNEWVFTEKVDGTNIRVDISYQRPPKFGGRTNRAEIPEPLLTELERIFIGNSGCYTFDDDVFLYGEGYGPKIQKGGGNYCSHPSFVLFDVRVGDWWLKREQVEEVAQTLSIQTVPIIKTGTLYDAVEDARKGIKSTWGDFESEGYVLRPKTELFDRNNKRIVAKIKCKDFKNEH